MAERKLDADMRRLLLGDMPFYAGSTVDYTPEHYKVSRKIDGQDVEIPEEYRPVFSIRAWNTQERDQANSLLKKIEDISSNNEKKVAELTRKAITGWQNVFDVGTGNEIDYKPDPDGGLDKELYSALPVIVCIQIFQEIAKISGLMDVTKMGLS